MPGHGLARMICPHSRFCLLLILIRQRVTDTGWVLSSARPSPPPCLLFLLASRAPACSDHPVSYMQPPSPAQRHYWSAHGGSGRRARGPGVRGGGGGGTRAGRLWGSPSETQNSSSSLQRCVVYAVIWAHVSSLGEQADGRVRVLGTLLRGAKMCTLHARPWPPLRLAATGHVVAGGVLAAKQEQSHHCPHPHEARRSGGGGDPSPALGALCTPEALDLLPRR